MNIFGDGSDAWDSTPTQDVFIQNYFRKDEPSKRSRKRKKPPLSSGTVSTSQISTCHENEIPKQKNLNKKHKLTSNLGLETVSQAFNNEKSLKKYTEFKPSTERSPKNKLSVQKTIKNSKKNKDNDISDIDKSSTQDLQNKDSFSKIITLKKCNKANTILKSNKALQIQKTPAAEAKVKSKELQVAKKTKNIEENFINNSEGEVIQIKKQNRKKRKSKANKHAKTDELENSEIEMLDNGQKNLKEIKAKPNKPSHSEELEVCEEEVTHNEMQKLKKKKRKRVKVAKKPTETNESEDSEKEMLQNKGQNLRKKAKTSKPSQREEFEVSEEEVTENHEMQKLKKRKRVKVSKKPTEKNESEDSENEMLQNKRQNLRKKAKTSKLSHSEELDDSKEEVTENNKMQKLKKRKRVKVTKKHSETNESEDSENEMLQNKQQNLRKKAKTNKPSQMEELDDSDDEDSQNELSDENCLNIDDSEEDEVIRNELKNTRMFRQIKRLMKEAPHLNPNYDENADIEEEYSSIEDISTEDSSSEGDGEYASGSEDEEELEIITMDSSSDHSEDSSNNGEGDSSESDEEDVESQDSHQTTSEQNIPLQRNTQKTSNVKKPNTMLEKARAKMASAKFRFLNEKLYTESGEEAFRYFQENREEFDDYHLGYGQQVAKWPLNPVDVILAELQKMNKTAVIADLGCGDAKIARVLTTRTVHSFDLVAMHECVTACDVSKVPLRDGCVDVAVFCLSLMGINLLDYLREAYRILKIGGTLKIAEVESRIEDLDDFIKNLANLGFALERKNTKNKLFVFLDLKKVKRRKAAKGKELTAITLRPCMYKKR